MSTPASDANATRDRGPSPERRRNPWIWISGLLALVAAGLLIWALTARSEKDKAQDELAGTQQQLEATEQDLDDTQQQLDATRQDVDELQAAQADDDTRRGGALLTAGAFAVARKAYNDVAGQLGATQDDLAATQQELQEATGNAEQAEQDADAAKQKAEQAGDKTEKAQAEADQAKAEAEAAQTSTVIAAECARAYVAAFGGLFEGDDPAGQAAAVRNQLEAVTAECGNALADS